MYYSIKYKHNGDVSLQLRLLDKIMCESPETESLRLYYDNNNNNINDFFDIRG